VIGKEVVSNHYMPFFDSSPGRQPNLGDYGSSGGPNDHSKLHKIQNGNNEQSLASKILDIIFISAYLK